MTDLLLGMKVVICADTLIVCRCRVWESHADTEARRFGKPSPGRVLPIYTVNEPGCWMHDHMVAAVTIPPAEPDPLETLFR